MRACTLLITWNTPPDSGSRGGALGLGIAPHPPHRTPVSLSSQSSAAAAPAAKPAPKAGAKAVKKAKYVIDLSVAEKDKLLKTADFVSMEGGGACRTRALCPR